jgi:hypothetical protein
MTARPSTATPILAVLAIVLPMIYVGGYFWLGTRNDLDPEVEIVRIYPQQWLAKIYDPASRLEAWARNVEVTIMGPADLIPIRSRNFYGD